MIHRKKVAVWLISASILILQSACGTQKNTLSYFNDLKAQEAGTLTLVLPEIKIEPEDVITINVTSLQQDATVLYNSEGTENSYKVDSKGDIIFPVLGEIHVAGYTTQELSAYLKGKIEETVIDPSVNVELTSFRVEVLGEVNEPGIVTANKERFTILDAIAASGDLTQYGERDNILLLRPDGNELKYYHLSLNDSKLLSSPLFYLKQNDVVIVEPNDIKKDNSKYNTNNAYRLQVISTVVAASSVIASLAIALLVK